jgi:hypothetical protein
MFLGLWRFTGQGGAAISPVMFAILSSDVNYGASFAFISVSAFVVAYLVARHVPESADKTVALRVRAADDEESRAAAVPPEPDALPGPLPGPRERLTCGTALQGAGSRHLLSWRGLCGAHAPQGTGHS